MGQKKHVVIGSFYQDAGGGVFRYIRVSKESPPVEAGDYCLWVEGKRFTVIGVKPRAEFPVNLLAGVAGGEIAPGNYGWIQVAGSTCVSFGPISEDDRLI